MRRKDSWLRRVSIATIVVFGLTIAAPSGQQRPAGPNRFPLAALVDLFTIAPGWAKDPTTPKQTVGGPVNGAHEVSVDATRAGGGNGLAPGKTPGSLPEQEQPAKQDEPEVKTPAKTGFVEGESVWLEAESSETTDRYRNPDGTITNRVHQTQMNIRGADGKLHRIDTTLRAGKDGRLETTGSPVQVSFTGFAPAVRGGKATAPAAEIEARAAVAELAGMTFPGGQELGYTLQGAKIGKASTMGSQVTYREVLPTTDLELIATKSGVKETLILKGRGNVNSWVFPLRLVGLTAKVDVDGSIALIGSDGKPVAAIPRGNMQDSKVQADGEFTTSNGVTYELIVVNGKQALKITADKSWLDDPARVYPVRLDPSASLWDDLGDVYVDANSVQNVNSLGVGCFGTPCDRRRSFLSFANFGSYAYGPPNNSLYGMRITGATLNLFHTWSEDCPSTRTVRAYKVTQDWSRTSMPNGKYPGAAVGEMIGEVYISNNSPACGNSSGNRSVGTWWAMPITNLNIFNEWSLDYHNNRGIALTSENDDDRKGWKRFTSRDYDPSYGSYAPYVDFTWEYNAPPQIDRQYPTYGYASPTLNPELLATTRDPDGWPRALTHYFEIFTLGGGAAIANSGEISASSWRVPDGVLKWGQTYLWRVMANDGRNWTEGDWTPLTTPVPQPPITSSLSQNGGHGFTPTTGNYTTSVTDAPITVAGPPLGVTRSYNSRDPRTTNAFGAGWSSILDAGATEFTGGVVVTYPTGQNVAFGKNPDGTWNSPQGKFSTFTAVTNPTGYELVDKEGTKYRLTAATATGVYGLSSITDIQGRVLDLIYENNRPSWITSRASNRTVHVHWTTGATPHVDQLATDPIVTNDWNTANYWRYTYVGDKLDKVCQPEPADSTSCTRYEYGSNTLQPTAIADARPHTYLRLDEAPGAATAASSVITRDTAIGVYGSNVTLAQTGRDGSPTVAKFNGNANSYVELSGKKLPLGAAYQSVSVWFKTTSPGVIYSYQAMPIADAAGVQWNPALYVGTDGLLHGRLWNSLGNESVSGARVDNDAWHHVALIGAGGTQTMYVDGVPLAAKSGTISPNGVTHAYLGAGKWDGWPASTGTVGYFNGLISDFAWFDRPLSDNQVKLINSTGSTASAPLTKVIRPTNGVQTEITYTSSGTVDKIKDANGGTWTVTPPAISVNDQTYASAVIGSAPADYFRFKESGVTEPYNEVNGGKGTYSSVTLGVDGGPFGPDVDVASFDGATSFVTLPKGDYANGNSASTVSMWFRTTASGVLYGAQGHPISELAAGGWSPSLYVGTDGKLRGGYWGGGQMTADKPVNDGAWHHVALTSTGLKHSLYLDSVLIGIKDVTIAPETFPVTYAYVGAGRWRDWAGSAGEKGFFKGEIGDFAYLRSELKQRDIAAQFAARDMDRSAGAAPYLSAALAEAPLDHFRLSETVGAVAVNQVAGGPTAAYQSPRFNVDGPFSSATSAAMFNGNSTFVQLPSRDMVGTGAGSVSLWFNAPPGRTGVLYSYEIGVANDMNPPGYVPALYVDVDGKLRGKFWDNYGSGNQMVSTGAVNDGEWHHVVLATTGSFQKLYLDGLLIGHVVSTLTGFGATHAGLGVGKWLNWPATTGWLGWFTGQISEFGYYPGELWQAKVTSLYTARDKAISVPAKKVKVTDPMGGVTTHVYDVNDGRQLEQIDPMGGRTTFGYDSGGFLYSVTDPNGNTTVNEHDLHGNTVTQITCQDRVKPKCTTVYKKYDAKDKVIEVRDGRSSNKDDNAYLTTYTYDAAGNQTEIKDSLGRVTRTEYTNGTVIQADLTGATTNAQHVRMNGSLRGIAAGFSLWDLEVFGPTGKDLALGKTVTSSSVEGASTTTVFAVDGNPNTRWSSAYTDTEWIKVDLGSVQAINRVKLNWETAYGRNYKIEVSTDGTNWTEWKAVTNQVVDYIPAGLPWRTTTPGGSVETVSYLLNGDVDYTVDEAGLTTRFGYDVLGRATEKREVSDSYPAGLVTQYTYDRKSRLKTQRDPAVQDRILGTKVHTQLITAVYNLDDQVTSTTYEDANGLDATRTATINYNGFGQKAWESDALGDKTYYTYDLLGRMTEQKQPDNSIVKIDYDANSRPVLTKVNGQEMQSRSYDKGGRLSTRRDAMGWETRYKYTDNNLSAIVTRVNPATGAEYVMESNTYDVAGNLTQRITNNGATVTDYAVDPAGRNTSQTLDPNGLKRTVSYVYGPDNQLLSAKNSDGPTTSQVLDYTYDQGGRKVSQTLSTAGNAGLMARWKLDTDGSDTTRAFPVTGTPTWSSERGGSAAFDGVDDKFATSGPVLDTTRNFTVSGWIKISDRNGFYPLAAQMSNQVNGFWLGYDKGADKWSFTVYTGDVANAGVAMAAATAQPQLNTWVHLTGVRDFDANQTRLYINGQLQATLSNPPAAFRAKGPLLIGAHQYNGLVGSFLKGGADDVQVYQSKLSDAQITDVYNGVGPADAKSDRTTWTLDQRGLALTETDPNGNTTSYVYDENEQLAISMSAPVATEVGGGTPTEPTPQVNAMAYNTFGEAVETKDALNEHTYVERDLKGQVTSQWLQPYTPPGSATPLDSVTYTEYDSMGRTKATVDQFGERTTLEYDQYGQLKKITSPDLGITDYTYDLNGQTLSVTDPTGARTEATYDYLGRKVTDTDVIRQTGQSNVTSYGYHASGWLASITPQGRASSTFEYNAAGEQTKVTDGKGNATVTDFDFAGRQVQVKAPDLSKQQLFYDYASRPITDKQLSPADVVLTTTSVTYDNNGNPASMTDARGTTSTFKFNAVDLLTEMSQPVSGTESIVTTFGYDPSGNATRFTDGRGSAFITTYNRWGLPETQVEPGGATFTTVYDKAGRPVEQRAPGGVTTTSTYDVMGRLKKVMGSGAEVSTQDRTFGYDKAGRTTLLSGPGGDNTLTYDDRGLLTAVTGPSGNSSYGYTIDGLMSSRVDAAGTTNYQYDEIGRLKQTANTTAGLQLDYTYNNLSQLQEITFGGTGNKRTFTYDPLHQLESDTLRTSSNALVGKIEYQWDPNANLKKKTTTGFAGSSVNDYIYDLANRLASWNNGTTFTNYAYDKSGNRTQVGGRTFSYNARNQLTSSSDGTTYAYSPRGTLRTTTVGTVSLETQSDAFNQVIRQYSSATAYSEYTYDGLGRVLKPGFSYTGLGNDLAADPTGAYVRDAGNELVGVKPAGSGVYAWTDLHSDVVGQFGATSTALSGSTTYNPFGKVTASAGMVGSLGYQSEWTDTSTGRVNMHARWYNPDTGQFDSRDAASVSPVPNSGSANRYAYAAGNPMTRTDPSGNDWMENCKSVGGCIVQGFVNSFDAISAVKKIWNALSNVEKTVRDMWGAMKDEANKWKNKIRGMLPGAICGIWVIGGQICDSVAFIGGWACALSGVCEIVDDCVGGNTLKCAEHVGEALAEVVMGILSGGAASVGKHMLKRLLDKFDLPGKNRNGNGDNNSNNNGNGSNNNKDDNQTAADEKKQQRDAQKNNNKNNNTGGNNGKNNGKGGNSGGPSKPSNGAGSKGGNTPAERPAPPKDRQPEQRDSSAPPTCKTHSFDPATPVLMADGTAKPISDVAVGDKVAATDPATGETTPQAVTTLHVNLDRQLTELTVAAVDTTEGTTAGGEGDGDRSTRGPTATLSTTQNHPFWDVTTGQWINAKDLKPGQSTLTGPDGQLQLVVAVHNHVGAAQMRDLSVANIHTYYVLSGPTPVLVHNNDIPCPEEIVVLGINDKPFGSDALAKQLSDEGNNAYTFNGDPYGDPGRNGISPRWMDEVSDAVKDPNRKIAVALDGMSGKSALEMFTNAVRAGMKLGDHKKVNKGNGTNWEMNRLANAIMNGKRDGSDVRFYLGGERQRFDLPDTDIGWGKLKFGDDWEPND